jgi:ribonuclease Y
MEGTHVALGVEFARKYKEKEDIIHAIEAHHNDVEPHTVVACLVQAADAISAARPGARRENLENYIKRLEQLEEITTSFPGVEKAYAIQAGREVRVMVKPEQVSEDQMVILARDLAKKIEEELEYPRPDQGPRHPGDQGRGIRKVNAGRSAAVHSKRGLAGLADRMG